MTAEAIVALCVGALVIVSNALTCAYFFGRLTQRVSDLDKRIERIENAHPLAFKAGR